MRRYLLESELRTKLTQSEDEKSELCLRTFLNICCDRHRTKDWTAKTVSPTSWRHGKSRIFWFHVKLDKQIGHICGSESGHRFGLICRITGNRGEKMITRNPLAPIPPSPVSIPLTKVEINSENSSTSNKKKLEMCLEFYRFWDRGFNDGIFGGCVILIFMN